MTQDADKRAENEQLFRAANENLKVRLAELEEAGRIPFICECSDTDCMQVVEASLATFNDIHTNRSRYLLRTGHQTPEIEDVVDAHDGYIVVQRRGGERP